MCSCGPRPWEWRPRALMAGTRWTLPCRTPRWLIVSSASARTDLAGPRSTATSRQEFVVQMDAQGRDLQVVMPVLRLRKSPREIANLVVVDVGERGDTKPAAFVVELLARLNAAQDVAQRLRTAGIVVLSHVAVESCGEIIVDRQGNPLHLRTSACPSNMMYAQFLIDAYEIVPRYGPVCRRRRGTGANSRPLRSRHRRFDRVTGHHRCRTPGS